MHGAADATQRSSIDRVIETSLFFSSFFSLSLSSSNRPNFCYHTKQPAKTHTTLLKVVILGDVSIMYFLPFSLEMECCRGFIVFPNRADAFLLETCSCVLPLVQGGVGKSSLMNRYVNNTFDSQVYYKFSFFSAPFFSPSFSFFSVESRELSSTLDTASPMVPG